jgi:hypothetical protein
MSGDIEDFLRRAAERRQARQANKPAAPPPQAPRPEYSDARRERAPRARDDDELVVAEVVEEPLSRKLAELKRAQAAAQATREAARAQSRHGGSVPPVGHASPVQPLRPSERVPLASANSQGGSPTVTSKAAAPDLQNAAITDLHEILKTPQGLRSAILLHDILARPEHRW